MVDKAKISVVLQPQEFDRFDAFCRAQGYKKSTLIVRLIRELMDREGFATQTSLPFGESRTPGSEPVIVEAGRRADR